MALNRCLRSLPLCSLGILLLLGCGSYKPMVTSSFGTSTTTPTIPSVPANVTQIYAVVPGFATVPDWSPDAVFIFPASAGGVIDDGAAHLEIAGSHVAIDGPGNIYVLTTQGIQVTSPGAPGLAYRPSSMVDPAAVQDMAVSLTGEVFVSDGKGVAVFARIATSAASPARYIIGQSQTAEGVANIVPGHIAVDASDNLYVQNTTDSSIAVFGPTATGTVSPSRTIAGPLARLASSADDVRALTTDASGNLYVLCNCTQPNSTATNFGVFEFDPAASGNVAPIRFVTASQMTSFGTDGSIAVDLAGTIYVDARLAQPYTGYGSTGGQVIFQFSAGASGSVAPYQTTTLPAYGSSPLKIAVH